MGKPLVIDGIEVLPGTHKDILLKIARLPTHTEIELPVSVFRGKEDGPVLLLTSSLHGDEVNGTESLRRMIRKGTLKPKKGTVIVMPVVNVYGFLLQTRTLPDGKDLNRSFPGSQSGSLARRLAHILLTKVVKHVDYAIDLHTGGASRTNYPQIRCDFERSEALAIAKAFGAPFLLDSKEIPGSFRRSASKLGKTMIVFEGGESQRFDEIAINEAIDGISRVMAFLNMVTPRVASKESLILTKNTWIRARISGLFIPEVTYGAHVTRGQVLAQIGDPFGDTAIKILAPYTGYVIGLNYQPVISAGDAVINLAAE